MKNLLDEKILSENQLLKILGGDSTAASAASRSTNPRTSDQDSSWVCTTCWKCKGQDL